MMTMPDLQWYPQIIYLIKNVEIIVVNPTRNVLNSANLFIASFKARNTQFTFAEKPQININNLNNKKY